MPELVVVPSDFERSVHEVPDGLIREGRRRHEYVERFIRQQYRHVVYNDGGIMLLARSGAAEGVR